MFTPYSTCYLTALRAWLDVWVGSGRPSCLFLGSPWALCWLTKGVFSSCLAPPRSGSRLRSPQDPNYLRWELCRFLSLFESRFQRTPRRSIEAPCAVLFWCEWCLFGRRLVWIGVFSPRIISCSRHPSLFLILLVNHSLVCSGYRCSLYS